VKTLDEVIREITNPSTTRVFAHNCQIQDQHIPIILAALQTNRFVTSIDLSKNQISTVGAEKIAQFMLSNNFITSLILDFDNISPKIRLCLEQSLNDNKLVISELARFIKHDIEQSGHSFLYPDTFSHNPEKYKFFQVCDKTLLKYHLVNLDVPEEQIQKFFDAVHEFINVNIGYIYQDWIPAPYKIQSEIISVLSDYLGEDSLWPPLPAEEFRCFNEYNLAHFIKNSESDGRTFFSPVTLYDNFEKFKFFQVCDKTLLEYHLIQLGFAEEHIQKFFADVTTFITGNIECIYSELISTPKDAKTEIQPIINSYLGSDSLWLPLSGDEFVQKIDSDMIGLDGPMVYTPTYSR